MPQVSVIIPLYNRERFIQAALQSVREQTYSSYEALVVDDGSTDKGPALVESLSNDWPALRLLRHPDEKNHGIAATRNRAIREARGTWIAFLDSDDVWLPKKLEQQMAALTAHPVASLCYSMMDFIDNDGTQTSLDSFTTLGKGEPGVHNIFKQLVGENLLPTPTVVVSKSAVLEAGSFSSGPRFQYEDWLLWTKITRKYESLFLPEVLAHCRLHGQNITKERQGTTQHFDAELHFVSELYAHLIRTEGLTDEIRNLLMHSCRRVLLRARTWRASREDLERQKRVLEGAFPFLTGKFDRFITMLSLIPASSAQKLRCLRRKVVRL